MDDNITQHDLVWLHAIRDRVREEMKGIDGIINLLLIALVVRGHVLLEGNPGLGKTALVRSLCAAMDLPPQDMGRIQFTPDLMPSDITGTRMPDDSGRLAFQKGPVFCRLLLADEINRATPKTQAAMLEAMAEAQVTVLGTQYPLAAPMAVRDGTDLIVRPPFMVMATQNPVEQEGTYQLPEAQLDRFLFKALMPFPARDTLAAIVAKDAGLPRQASRIPAGGGPDATYANLNRLGRGLRSARPSDDVQAHILNVVMASVGRFDQVEDPADAAGLRSFARERLRYELGPRAAISLTLATLGWAALAEIIPQEVSQLPARTPEALAQVAVPVLRHRMRFEMDYEAGGSLARQHDDLVRQFVKLCAPARRGYADSFAAAIRMAGEAARI